jgi:transposase
MLTRAGK